MPTMIDHIVIISDDLNLAIDNARNAGFTVIPGGTHAAGDTHNALIGFADGCYIELIAPTEQGRSGSHRWFERLRKGGGLVDFCLLSDDLASDVASIRDRGIAYPDPFEMGRNRPDGERIDWRLSTPPGNVGETGWPFMIEDVTPRERRVPTSEIETLHANGATGVGGVTVLVRDLDEATDAYAAILNTRPATITFPGGSVLGRQFQVGHSSHWIRLIEATTSTTRRQLNAIGQGPYRLTLTSDAAPEDLTQGRELDPNLFSSAHIELM